ncbi:DUF2268 domain-containing protein [Natranaeroarchaeum aerophilus]|uniref:DUF2268 domain-containing protein n=1 Tax=Natranaeroarchaeum aerophilus TaxID=2917711 RepID=A0AAE3FU66_9EURY|nr:DUF2268 domain-containing protein [Natranaeroarchaeum aerophilus]MCL9815226.1 DUF2268 domain-containing protein [Natranaeroarchaeum aerophilus]
MVSRRVALTAVVVALLLLAGCTAPTPPPDVANGGEIEGEEAPTDEEPATDADRDAADTESHPDLDLDEDTVWNEVTTMMDSDAPQPDLFVDEMPAGADQAFEPQQSEFQAALNATESSPGGNGTSGLAMPGNVYVFPDGPDEEVEQVLVHEYAHAIQYADGMFASWLRSPPETTDEELLQTSLIEGGAVYVADEYTAENFPEFPAQSEQMAASYEAAPAGDRLLLAPYHYGAEYVHAEIDNAEELPEVYRSHPVTTAGMLDPDSQPPATDLDVDVETSDSDWSVERTDRKGELYTRIVLDTELSNDEATDAAAGWSDDELVAFEDADGQDAFVWTTQWETEDDADAFAAAFESKLDSRTDNWADRTAVERPDDRTVSVLIGPDEFRSAVNTTMTNSTVDLDLGTTTAAPALTAPAHSAPTSATGAAAPVSS